MEDGRRGLEVPDGYGMYLLQVILAGHIYLATPVEYPTLDYCERTAKILRLTAGKTVYRCVPK